MKIKELYECFDKIINGVILMTVKHDTLGVGRSYFNRCNSEIQRVTFYDYDYNDNPGYPYHNINIDKLEVIDW